MENYWPLIQRHLEHHAIKEITLSCQNLLFRFPQLGQTLFASTFLYKYEFNEIHICINIELLDTFQDFCLAHLDLSATLASDQK